MYIDVHPSHVKTLPVRYHAGLWGDAVEVADVGDEAAAFLAKVVGKDDPSFVDARVVSIVDSSVRKVNERYCPDAARVGMWSVLPQGGLTDGFPVRQKSYLLALYFVFFAHSFVFLFVVRRARLSDSGCYTIFVG